MLLSTQTLKKRVTLSGIPQNQVNCSMTFSPSNSSLKKPKCYQSPFKNRDSHIYFGPPASVATQKDSCKFLLFDRRAKPVVIRVIAQIVKNELKAGTKNGWKVKINLIVRSSILASIRSPMVECCQRVFPKIAIHSECHNCHSDKFANAHYKYTVGPRGITSHQHDWLKDWIWPGVAQMKKIEGQLPLS